jgi:uncharacterized protein YbbC (DUF1343 family)/CubicO group peptidase (beta-lactamase class C family)
VRARLIAFLAPVLAVVCSPAAAQQPPDLSELETAARDAVASGEIPGVVVLVGRGDEVLYHGAFGFRSLVPDVAPMALDTIFDIASLTKPFGTAIAVMALVEKGAIELDAPLGKYLKEFKGNQFRNVTIRRLLTHSAGFPGFPPNTAVAPGFPRAATAISMLRLDYPPGYGFVYSDTGFILLGEVVRRVSGQSLDRFLDKVLFKPLGLTDTSFHPSDRVRSRVAPTEFFNGRMLRGEVNDARARLLGGIAGHAGMFSTATDLARISRMLLAEGILDGKRVLNPETVRLMFARSAEGQGTRTLGWDMTSSYATSMTVFFPAGSVGHTGFTGTSAWLDPASRTYLLVLTNRLHPNGGGAARIRELRTRTAAAAGAALFQPTLPAPPAPVQGTAADDPSTPDGPLTNLTRRILPAPPAPRVRSGLDVLVERNFAILAGQTVGLVTNQTGVDGYGRRAIDLLAAAPNVKLGAIFSPEHGLTGDANTTVPNARDAATGRPVWSLYNTITRRPTAEMLSGITMLVFDIQDVGARYYTYLTTLMYVMEEAAKAKIPVVVLDRPNPITGRVVEGPMLDPDLLSFTAPHLLPVRTGMTIGEFARMVAAERKIPVALTVVPLQNWDRSRWYDETGLAWINPSPNIRSVTQALLYSGIGLLESTNLSVGRGTDTPFELIGAPWIEPQALADELNRRGPRGVKFEPIWFTPSDDMHANVLCGGVRFVVTDRDAIRPVTVAFTVASALRGLHRDQFRPESIQNLLVNRSMMWAFLRGEPLERLLSWADMERTSFLNRRASYLIYP